MAHLYILHSKTLNKYYVGHTDQSLEERLKKHLTDHKGFTGKAKDWEIAYTQEFETKEAAYAAERKVKNWKSKSAIERLIENGG